MKLTEPKIWIATVITLILSLICSSNIAFAMEARLPANLKGIDVSHWDGVIDWKRLPAQHIRFAYIKATGGQSFVDPRFFANVRGARTHHIAVGAYHYATPSAPYNAKAPVEQATLFVHTMKIAMGDYGDIMPVLDVEQTGSLSTPDLVRWIRSFVDTVQHLTHRKVMLYTSEDFIQKHTNLNGKLSGIPLWVAYYDRYYGGRRPPNIAGWSHWSVWQYSDRGVIRGVPADVDLNAGPTSLVVIRGDVTTTAQSAKRSSTDKTATRVSANAHLADNNGRQNERKAKATAVASSWSTGHEVLICIMSIGGMAVILGLTFRVTRRNRKSRHLPLDG